MLAVHEQGNYQFDGSATSAERYFLSEREVLRQLISLRLRRRIRIFVNQHIRVQTSSAVSFGSLVFPKKTAL